MLACPVCGLALLLGATSATCPANHSFDRARSGYLNLLLSGRKPSAEAGDSASMMHSRRAFLQAGFYDQMSVTLNTAVVDVLAGKTGAAIADVGCGEGFFSTRLRQALAARALSPHCFGLDISRPGIRMAAAVDRETTWVVASLHRSPFVPKSLDVVLSVFAPINAPEVRRVLRDAGVFVTMTPGPDHLDALRAAIYATVTPHPEMPALMADDTLFEHCSATRVRYPIVVDSAEQIRNLLAMTPYYWNISLQTRRAIESLVRLETVVDASVNVFRPRLKS